MKIHGYVIGITALLLSASATGCGVESLPEGDLDLSKENLQEVVETVTETTNDVAGKIAEKAEESGLTEKAKDLGKAGEEKVEEAAKAGAEKLGDVAEEKLKEALKEKLEAAGENGAQKVKESLEQGLESAQNIDENTIKELLNNSLKNATSSSEEGSLSKTTDIGLTSPDGSGSNYVFTYNGETFSAIYSEDNWQIIDSYRIDNSADMMIICQALIDEHPVHGRDMVGYRTAEDMVYEWEIHNLAYAYLGDDENLSNKARDVDFNPEDQGKTLEEIYYDRTGKELSISDFLN